MPNHSETFHPELNVKLPQVVAPNTQGETSYYEPLIHVSPDFFLERNHTSEVQENLDAWYENKRNGKLIAVGLCGDARVWIPEMVARKTASVRTLGAAGDQEFKQQFASIMNSNSVGHVVFMGHYDGQLFSPQQAPRGCGITDEHGRQLDSGEEACENGYQGYARNHVHHEDPVMQTIYSSLDAQELTNKLIGAVALDHRSGTVVPVGFFRHEEGYSSETGINPRFYDKRSYNASKIYETGIPVVTKKQLETIPDELTQYFNNWNTEMKQMRDRYPSSHGTNYEDALKIQNPSVISMSTDPRPVGIRYRLGPNTVFKLRVPRQSIDDDELIAPQALQLVLDQAHYPIAMNTKHYDQPGTAFSNTHTLLIETKNMEKSLKVAEVAISQPFIQEWLQLPNSEHTHQILVGQVNKGVTEHMEIFARGK